MSTIVIKYRHSLEIAQDAAASAYWRGARNPLRAVLFLVVGTLLIGGLVYVVTNPNSSAGYQILGSGLLYLVLMWGLRSWSVRRNYRQHADHDSEVLIQVLDDGLYVQSKSIETKLRWAALQRIVEAKKGFLLYITVDRCFWIPRVGFSTDADSEAFIAMAGTKVPVIRRRRRESAQGMAGE